jgi:hypothetical protein
MQQSCVWTLVVASVIDCCLLFQEVLRTMHSISGVMQMEGLLREEAETGGDICGLVVDLAVEVASYIMLASLNAAKQIGLESITLLGHQLLTTADSACAAAHRGVQQLLDVGVTSLHSSSTIDLSAAADEHPSGMSPLQSRIVCAACFCLLTITLFRGPKFSAHMQAIY